MESIRHPGGAISAGRVAPPLDRRRSSPGWSAALGWVGVYLVPNQFESSARLYVDADAILTPLLRGLAADFGPGRPARNACSAPCSAGPTSRSWSRRPTSTSAVTGPSDRERLLQSLANDDPGDPADQEPVHHHLSQREPQAGARRGADAADDLRRKRHRHQPHRHGECAALPGAPDLLLRAAVARGREAPRRLPRQICRHPARPTSIPTRPTWRRRRRRANSVRELDGKLQDAVIKRDTLRQELANTPADAGGWRRTG